MCPGFRVLVQGRAGRDSRGLGGAFPQGKPNQTPSNTGVQETTATLASLSILNSLRD